MFSFNYWYLLAPLYAVVMFLIGTMKYRLTTKNRIVVTIKNLDGVLNVLAFALSLAMQVSIIAESTRGVLQLVIDSTLESEAGWIPILLTVLLMASFGTFFIAFFYCGKLGELAMLRLLKFLQRKMKGGEKRKENSKFFGFLKKFAH